MVKMRLTPLRAEKRIHQLASTSANIVFGFDALAGMRERGITDVQVLEILLAGFVSENPVLTEHNDWQCKITKELRGRREAGILIVILQNSRLFLKTVEWEDA